LIPGRGRDFSLLCSIQTSYEAHPASYLTNTRVKNVWSYTTHPLPRSLAPPQTFWGKIEMERWKETYQIIMPKINNIYNY
jgi:hypothetical protein